mmetsp:Transcript_15388/g.25412  ORF Transcript_15388/g.25412 Transcript_15388/m.25412 type:complete len:757 (+) Transcript_15388:161-2431(+)
MRRALLSICVALYASLAFAATQSPSPRTSPTKTPIRTSAHTLLLKRSPSKIPSITRSRVPTSTLTRVTPSRSRPGSPSRTRTRTPTRTPSSSPTKRSTPTRTPLISRTGMPSPTQTPTNTLKATPSPTRKSSNLSTVTPQPTRSPSKLPTNTPSHTRSASALRSGTPSPTQRPSHLPTNSSLPTPTPSTLPTSTPVPSQSPLNTRTNTASLTHTPSNSPTSTPMPSQRPSNTHTNAASLTQTPSNSPTSTLLPSQSPSYSHTNMASLTQTPSTLPTSTLLPSQSPSDSPTDTASVTQTPSPSLELTYSPTGTPSPTQSPSESPSGIPSPTYSPSQSPLLSYQEYYPGQNWTLKWSDEFDGPSINQSKWNYDIGGGGWGNSELEVYTNGRNNSFIQDGYLNIKAVKSADGTYTSARMVTRDRYSFAYGKLAIRARLPYGKGIWPALWLLGPKEIGWPRCGEIDIMEIIGGGSGDSTMYCTIHYDNNGHVGVGSGALNPLDPLQIFHNAFHVFELEWTAAALTFRLDGNLLWKVPINQTEYPSRSAFHQPFYLLMNVAVGGSWPGSPDATTVFPQTMLIDWVRYYQWSGSGDPPPPLTPTPRPNHVLKPWRQFASWANDPKAHLSLTYVYISGVPTETIGLHIATLDSATYPWDCGVYWPTIVAVTTADVLNLSFYARLVSPVNATVIQVHVIFETGSAPFVRSLSRTTYLSASTSWSFFTWTFSPVANYSASAASIKFLVGFGPQEYEISDVILVRQ